jgi:hypothetical protein
LFCVNLASMRTQHAVIWIMCCGNKQSERKIELHILLTEHRNNPDANSLTHIHIHASRQFQIRFASRIICIFKFLDSGRAAKLRHFYAQIILTHSFIV